MARLIKCSCMGDQRKSHQHRLECVQALGSEAGASEAQAPSGALGPGVAAALGGAAPDSARTGFDSATSGFDTSR